MKSTPKKSKSPQNKTNPKKLPINRGVKKAVRSSSINIHHIQLQNQYYLWGAVCLIVVAVLLAYSNSFGGPFIYDDIFVIKNNPTILRLWPLGLFQQMPEGIKSGTLHVIFSRPITNWTFALNYALGGLNPFGYHVFNVLMHLCSSLLVFGIIRRTLLAKPLKERWGNHALLLSLAIALLWAVHPLQTNAIDYITQRLESLAGFFYLATLYCLIRGHDPKNSTRWLSIGVLAAFLGMGSKETMVTAPVVLLLYDRAFLAVSFKEALTKRAGFYVGLVLAWVFLAILLINGHTGSIGTNERGGSSNAWSYAATQLGVVLHYLKLAVWPNPLILDNYWSAANTINAILWPGLAVALMAGLTLWGFIKNRPWAFIGLWFFIILSPSSSFVPIMDEYVNEYRMYLPVLAPITLLVMGLYIGLQKAAVKCLSNKIAGLNQTTILVLVLIIAAAIALGITTYERNKDYSSELIMWSDNVMKTPNNARAHMQLGVVWYANNQQLQAIKEYKKAIEIYPNNATAHGNLGISLAKINEFQAAIFEFREALALNKGDLDASTNLQSVLNFLAIQDFKAGNKGLAIDRLKEVLAINPNNVDAKKNLTILTGK